MALEALRYQDCTDVASSVVIVIGVVEWRKGVLDSNLPTSPITFHTGSKYSDVFFASVEPLTCGVWSHPSAMFTDILGCDCDASMLLNLINLP